MFVCRAQDGVPSAIGLHLNHFQFAPLCFCQLSDGQSFDNVLLIQFSA